VLCPPFVYLAAAAGILGDGPVLYGAQDCSDQDNGAFTGDISATMLGQLGCKYVILGHSERRQYHCETDAEVKAKATKAIEKGLKVIICVGETLGQREAGQTMDVIKTQLKGAIPETATVQNTVIAYEPVWAIGTGLVASVDQIAEVHGEIRKNTLDLGDGLRVIYGGSVKPDNAQDILSLDDVDGALVGGASLKGKDFLEIAAKAV
jgi:triosephosphate isomerase